MGFKQVQILLLLIKNQILLHFILLIEDLIFGSLIEEETCIQSQNFLIKKNNKNILILVFNKKEYMIM